MKRIKVLLCLVLSAIVAGWASAGVTLVKSGDAYRITVPEGTVNRAGTVTLVWDTSDKGNTLADWSNAAVVTTELTSDGGTYAISADGVSATSVARAFVTEDVKFLSGAIRVPLKQYIDTGVKENTAYGLDVNVNVLSQSDTLGAILSGTKDKSTIGCNNSSTTSFYVRYNGTDMAARPTLVADNEGGNNILIRNKTLAVNGTAVTITTPSSQIFYNTSTPKNLFLSTNAGHDRFTSDDWYYVRIFDANNVCLRDMWPAQIGNEYGLWDKIEGKFYGASVADDSLALSATGSLSETCTMVRGISAAAIDAASGIVASATWTGAAADRNPANAANWECKDLNGNVLSGAVPTDDTEVTLSGAVGVDFPAGFTLHGKSIALNATLDADAAWRGSFKTTAVGEELPYVDVGAGAYVDTGFKPTALTHAVMEVTVQNTREYWFGVWDSGFNSYVFSVCNNGSGIFSGWSKGSGDSTNLAGMGRHTVELDKGKVIVDGTEIRDHSSKTGGFPITHSLYLFDQNRKGTAYYGAGQTNPIRFHSFKLYEDDELVLDYVPMRRTADGKLGIYDRVSQAFVTIKTGSRSSSSATLQYGAAQYPAPDGTMVPAGVDVTPLPEGATVDLAGHTLTWAPHGTTVEAATITSSVAGGDLVLDIAEGTSFTNTQVSLTGSLKVEKQGLGTWSAGKILQSYTEGTDIEAGTAIAAPVTGDVSYLPFGGKQAAKGVSMAVRKGATLDLNGKVGWGYTALTLDGGTVTGASLKPNFALTLTDDSTFTVAAGNLGSTYSGRSGVSPNLNGHTLTLDMTDGWAFYLQSVTGAGTILAKGNGSVTTWQAFQNQELTLDMREETGLVLDHAITVSNYLSSCTSAYSAGTGCVSVVTGVFKPTTTHFSGVVLTNGTTLDLTAFDATWDTMTHGTGSDNAAVTFADGAAITVDVHGRTLALGDKIVSWTTSPVDAVSFDWDDVTKASGVSLVETTGGIFYGADPDSTVVETAEWTNTAGDNDLSNTNNWTCKNAAGKTIAGALPPNTVTVTISGDVNADFPTSNQVFPGRALKVNVRLTGDVDWSLPVYRRKAVPAEYIFIKTGAYFNTLFCPNQDSAVVLDVTIGGTQEYWCGTWNGNYKNGAFCVCNDTSSLYAGYGNQGGDYGTSLAAGGRHTIALDQGVVSVDGTNTVNTFSATTFQCRHPLLIGAQNRCGQASAKGTGVQLHGAKVYDNGTLIRDYIPIRFEDGTGALYDQVSGTCVQPTLGSAYCASQNITGTGEVTPYNGSVDAGPASSGTDEYIVAAAPVFADGSSFDLNGHMLTLSGALPPSGSVAITDSSAGQPGTLKFDVPENATFWNSRVSIDGNLKLVKLGAGLFCSYLPLGYTGGTEVEAGVYRFNGGYATVAAPAVFVNGTTPAGAEGTTITVKDGATLDLWAHEALGYTYQIKGNGTDGNGVLLSSRNYYQYWAKDILHDVILTGDAKIGALFAACKRSWALNGNTLTLAKNDTYVTDMVFAGEGTIVADGGSGRFEPLMDDDGSDGFVAANASFEVRAGTTLSMKGNVRVKNFTHAGGVTCYAGGTYDGCAVYVSGRYTPVSATQPPVVFTGTENVLDLSQLADTLASTLVDPAEKTIVGVELGTRTVSSTAPLMTWTTKPTNLTFTALNTSGLALTAREDGLYIARGLIISVR